MIGIKEQFKLLWAALILVFAGFVTSFIALITLGILLVGMGLFFAGIVIGIRLEATDDWKFYKGSGAPPEKV